MQRWEISKLGILQVILFLNKEQKDGYSNTYFTVKEPGKRLINLHKCHEPYCADHMIEAAAY